MVRKLKEEDLLPTQQEFQRFVGKQYIARIAEIQMLQKDIKIEELRKELPNWKWLEDPQALNTEVPPDCIDRFRELLGIYRLIALHEPLSQKIKDVIDIENRAIGATQKRRLVDARLGQGKFRTDVLAIYGNRCAITKSATSRAIRASHIKPWKHSDDSERLDPNNGLPLIATLDALFDAGLITFDQNGELLASPQLNPTERGILGLQSESLSTKPNSQTAKYLAYHRRKVFASK